MKKATKKVVAKVTTAPKTPTMVEVGRPAQKTVNVFGIDFEQGNEHKFGKAIRPADGYNPPRVWNFILFDDCYIIWSRHHADRLMDLMQLTTAQWVQQGWQIVDFDTPIVTGAPPVVAPAAGLGGMIAMNNW
jgi:hypothetical protein